MIDSLKNRFATVAWGAWVAMAAAVILTAKGEFDLAVLAHFSSYIAWMFPVMIDVYVITSFHRKRRPDMVIGMLLMIFCQIAVHLLPVIITAGEKTPWGLVVAVACIAPVVVVRVKILTGRTTKEIAAEQEAAQRTDELHAARAETAAARQALQEIRERSAAEVQEIRAHAEAEAGRAQQEIAALSEAENRAAMMVRDSEIEAARQSEIRSEIESEIQRVSESEIRVVEARRIAEQRADEQGQLARLAEGRLAEARETADRAQAARVTAEQAAAAHMRQVSTTAEQADQQLRQQLAAATSAARSAERSVAELAEQVRTVQAQREEARASAERAGNRAAIAEQQITDLERGRDAAFDELEKVRRQLARATEKAEIVAVRQPEISGRRQPEISGRPARKSTLPVLAHLPENLPAVDGVRPEKVAIVLLARVIYPDVSQQQLAEITDISDRTIGKVVRAVPAQLAIEVGEQLLALAGGGKVLALTDGRAA